MANSSSKFKYDKAHYNGDVKVIEVDVDGKVTYILYPHGSGTLTAEDKEIAGLFDDGRLSSPKT